MNNKLNKIKETTYKFLNGGDTCPCSEVKWDKFKFYIHCWRVGLCCSFAGIHIQKYPDGELKEATRRAKLIAKEQSESWGTHFTVKKEPYKS